MNRAPSPRITLSIDRIVCDRPGLNRAALETALHSEISRLVTEKGLGALGTSGSRTQVRTTLPQGQGQIVKRVAAATVKAVKTGGTR